MAKVNKVVSKIKPGRPIAQIDKPKATVQANKTASKPVGVNQVKAIKNGQERVFARQIWDHLPRNKEGWSEVVDTPALPDTKKPDSNDENSYEDAVKTYTELFNESPGQDLSLDEIVAAVESKKGEQNNG